MEQRKTYYWKRAVGLCAACLIAETLPHADPYCKQCRAVIQAPPAALVREEHIPEAHFASPPVELTVTEVRTPTFVSSSATISYEVLKGVASSATVPYEAVATDVSSGRSA